MYEFYATLETVMTTVNVSVDAGNVVGKPRMKPETATMLDSIYFWNYPEDVFVPRFNPINHSHFDEAFDGFMDIMINDKDSVLRDEFLADEKIAMKQIEHTYRQWMAQQVSARTREDINGLRESSTPALLPIADSFQGTVTTSNHYRLSVPPVSARILEGVFGLLFICGAVVLFLVDMSNVLPKPVGRVGALVSLLADSQFVRELEPLVSHIDQWSSNTEIKEQEL